MTYEEEFNKLFEDADIMKISGCVGTRTFDSKISFCLGIEEKNINPNDYIISKIDECTYLLTNRDDNKNDRWFVNFYRKMWLGNSERNTFIK